MNGNVAFLLAGLIFGWLTLTVGWWLFGKVQQKQWQQRYGKPLDHDAISIKYNRLIAAALDQQAIGHLLTKELPLDFQVERAVLLRLEGHQLTDVMRGEVRLPVNHAAVRWVTSAGEAQNANLGRLREIIENGRSDIAWTSVWVPLMRSAELHGLWLLGKRSRDLEYAPEDLACLTRLGRQAAVVLDTIHYAEQEQRAASEIRALYQRVVAAQEVERGRLSRDLHDSILQDLCAVSRDLKALEAQPQMKERLVTSLVARSGEAVNTLRAICNDLRPPLLQHDLAAALKALIEQMGYSTRPFISLQIPNREVRLPDDTAVAIFRIAQESLRNAIQHADASEIEVRLTNYPDRLRLTVTDDGRGIAGGVDPGHFVAQGHFGLAGMRERAAMIGAKLDVQSAPDYGTVVVLDIPMINAD